MPQYAGHSFRAMAPALSIALSTLLFLGYLTLFSPVDNEPVIVVYPPWTSQQDALGHGLIGETRLLSVSPNTPVIMVAPASNEYAQQARQSGAWFIIRARNIPGCSTTL
jgi:hypothetical protein